MRRGEGKEGGCINQVGIHLAAKTNNPPNHSLAYSNKGPFCACVLCAFRIEGIHTSLCDSYS